MPKKKTRSKSNGPHTKMSDQRWIASFDIGYRNLCFSIEEVSANALEKIKLVPKSKRYNQDGTPTDAQKKVLK